MSRVKAKKATTGELILEDFIAAYGRAPKGRVLNVYPWAVKIDRAIAAAERKAARKAVKAERERCAGMVVEFIHDHKEEPYCEVSDLYAIVQAIREARP